MSRARAEALVLVNWKGVFYERYLLDRHVTALEGANGAGKTTVMIAAYLVLLPDMSRLRFTNLGETGATGGDKGIWGRLGEMGRPAYAAIDFALQGSRRLVAGVHLERKGEPSVEPTPFVVTGLDSTVRLQELFLIAQGEREAVPELGELQQNAARLGGRLQRYGSAREYFAELFDEGVTPLRLGTDEERNKLNEMLRTSMTGGISRVLTSELRSFLLKEQSGLADTLQRMKGNLEACRRTRLEVHESQRLQREIGGVFEAGQRMFAATYLATRERAEERGRAVADAEVALSKANAELLDAEVVWSKARQELEIVSDRRARCEGQWAEAKDRVDRMAKALQAAQEAERRRGQLTEAEVQERDAARARETAVAVREERRAELRRAHDAHRRAASGLADLQAGLQELHRRADAHRQVVRRRDEAGRLLGRDALPIEKVGSLQAECRARLAQVDGERRDAAVRCDDAAAHQREHATVLAALAALTGGPVSIEQAHAAALDALRRYREIGLLAGRVAELTRDVEDARKRAERQRSARSRAQELGIQVAAGSAEERLRATLESVESERGEHEEAERSARAAAEDAERQLSQARSRRQELAQREPRWHGLRDAARRLTEESGLAIEDRAGLDRVRALVRDRLAATRKREDDLTLARERLTDEARQLIGSGGPFDAELLRIKDQLGADLLASIFEDVGIDQAASLEARLGPLATALVVDQPAAVVREIANRSEALPSVWLVGRDGGERMAAVAAEPAPADASDVVVREGAALRVTRIPKRPVLGRKAREKRAAELRSEAAARDAELEEQRAQARAMERLVSDGDVLLVGLDVWLAGDPALELTELRRGITELEAQRELERKAAARSAEAARSLRPRIDGLRKLLADASLLDPPDHAAKAEELSDTLRAATDARERVAKQSDAARAVEDGLDTLRRLPLSDADVEALRRRVHELRQERDLLDAAVEALDYVTENAEALDWDDAAGKLAHHEALVPAIQDQLAKAEAVLERAERAAQDADAASQDATSRWQDADGRRRAAVAQWEAAQERFELIGVATPTPQAEREARLEVDRLAQERQELDRRLQQLSVDQGRREEAHRQAADAQAAAEEKLASERREAEPALERWARLRKAAAERDLLLSLTDDRTSDLAGIRGYVNLVQEANRHKAVLVERLNGAQGTGALLERYKEAWEPSDREFAERHLELWLAVRDWLRQRLPAQVSEVPDPREALARLGDQLASLEERLARHESDLRGDSESVARAIEVQVRKARGQVQRLNKNLDGVSFGGIRSIRVRLQPVERMEQVLRALREGAAQGLLFQADLPIEDALDEIFRRYAGGRTGGQRLLDYREYIHLQVEIRRTSGTDWEIANPTRLSTGEAIGVGAALMMVVLTEWERDANLIRGRRSSGSLRFLFLDEANRLSQDNLGVLFDLCQSLDLQLLIASPEVARAEGNTTYRLVRHRTSDGREEVTVSGRRLREEA